tara:strand:+ start:249 stop:1130 length:882 start_codon:yes stop_codon:yes gene_type:complete
MSEPKVVNITASEPNPRPKKKQKLLSPHISRLFRCELTSTDENETKDEIMLATHVVRPAQPPVLKRVDSSDEEPDVDPNERFTIALVCNNHIHFQVGFKLPAPNQTTVDADSCFVAWEKIKGVQYCIPKAISCMVEIMGRMFPRVDNILYKSEALSECFNVVKFRKYFEQELNLAVAKFPDEERSQALEECAPNAKRTALETHVMKSLWRQEYFERMGFVFVDGDFDSMVDITCEELETLSIQELRGKHGDPVRTTDELAFEGNLVEISQKVPGEFGFRVTAVQEVLTRANGK